MSDTQSLNSVTSKILKTGDIKWKDIKFLQSENFKDEQQDLLEVLDLMYPDA